MGRLLRTAPGGLVYHVLNRVNGLGWGALLVTLLLPSLVLGGQARYVYDELGRLIQVVNEQGEVAVYTYDAVGNLLSIQRTMSSSLTPVVDSITPNSLNRGTQTTIVITGQHLLSGLLSTDNPGITVSNIVVTDDTVSAVFVTSLDAPTGTFQATLTTFYGSASVPFAVTQLSVAPTGLTALQGNQQVILDWDEYANPGLQGFHVYRGTVPGGPYTRLTSSLVATSYYRDQTVTNGVTYYYVVTATQSTFSESEYSNEVQASPQGGATTVCGTISTTRTWALTGSPYQVTCDVTVQNNATLTIEPGVEVRFSPGTGLNVSFSSSAGALSAVGTVAGPILFTSSSATPAPGDWKGLDFRNATIDGSTRLDRVIVEYGGAGTNTANITLSTVSFPIQHSTIRHSSGHGVRVQAGSGPTLNQNVISQNAQYGVWHDGASTGLVTLSGNTLASNGAYAVRMGANSNLQFSQNSYAGNTPDAVEVTGPTMSGSRTWPNDGVPYVVIADIAVQNSAVLTVEPGVHVRFAAGTGLAIALSTQAGGLWAVGTPTEPILFTSAQPSPAPGDWDGLDFRSQTFDANTRLAYVIVEYGGAGTNTANITLTSVAFPIERSTVRHSGGYGIRVQSGSSPTITNNVIANNAQHGLWHASSSTGTFANNDFQGNGNYAVRIEANNVGLLADNTYTNNTPNAIEVVTDEVNRSQTWQNNGVPFVITGDVTIDLNFAVLTLQPGTELRFGPGAGMIVASAISGRDGGLYAVGTAEAPIVFTSAQVSRAPGDWKGLEFFNNTIDASTRLDYVIVEYGGSGTNTANIMLSSVAFPIQHSTVRRSSGFGIRVQSGSNPTISHTVIADNAQYGLWHDGSATGTFTNNQFQGNGTYAIRVPANGVGRLTANSSGNAYSGNNPDAIEVAGAQVTITQTWRNEGVPFVVTGDVSVVSNAVVTVAAGVHVQFAAGIGLTIGSDSPTSGGLNAVGTATAPIVFTSAQLLPNAGDWDGLDFKGNTQDANTRLEYVVVEYGGAGTNTANVTITGASFPIQHSAIRSSSGYGIRLSSGNPAVNFNSITGNSLDGVFNATSTITVNAENNWWGDTSGPTHSSNPTGTGDSVSDFVDFTPWLTSPP